MQRGVVLNVSTIFLYKEQYISAVNKRGAYFQKYENSQKITEITYSYNFSPT